MAEISEFTHNGTLTHIIVNNGDGTGTKTFYNPDGSILSIENLTNLESITFLPLDATGALATLLVVLGTLTLEDASAALHEEPEHLIHEAEAWSLGGQ